MSEIKCTTIEKIGIIRQGANGWNKELRLVSWNDADPKYDIRDWSPDDEKMGKGITLTEEEARNLLGLLEKHFGIGSADIALSKNYNPDDNTVIIKNKALFELSHRDICVFNPDNKEWTYINGAITITRGAEDTSFKAGVTGDVDLNGSVDVLAQKGGCRGKHSL